MVWSSSPFHVFILVKDKRYRTSLHSDKDFRPLQINEKFRVNQNMDVWH